MRDIVVTHRFEGGIERRTFNFPPPLSEATLFEILSYAVMVLGMEIGFDDFVVIGDIVIVRSHEWGNYSIEVNGGPAVEIEVIKKGVAVVVLPLHVEYPELELEELEEEDIELMGMAIPTSRVGHA